ncbi:hypothetical protein HOY80DRAFT_1000464 [Tuber brumale]|nr:hypothetical protein HOY80DRAFT_1000464 [Tuber brumale]
MTDNKQCELRLQPRRKGKKRQNIHSSPKSNEERAGVIRIPTLECLKTSQRPKAPAPNRLLFQPPSDQFHFSAQQACQDTPDTTSQSLKRYIVIPGYRMIKSLEPQEVAQRGNPTCQVAYHGTMLIEHLETRIGFLLSRKLSDSSVKQSNPTPSLQSEPHNVSPIAPSHSTRQVINH